MPLLLPLLLVACTLGPVPSGSASPARGDEDPIPLVDVLDRGDLARLEEGGLSLGTVLSGEPYPAEARLDRLARELPAWDALSAAIAADLVAVAAEVDRPLVIALQEARRYPAGNVGRAFDPRWLRSELAFFRLAGLVQRVDRRDFTGGCGELRLVYRLAYRQARDEGAAVGSRLPLTLNLVLALEGPCPEAWDALVEASPEALLAGPLAPGRWKLNQVELNAQALRFPSGLETEFGGQAAYLLEVFTWQDGELRRRPLENTPDLRRIEAQPELRAALVDWIGAHLDQIDQGVYRLPDAFLADRALSWSTLGIHRLANKPFSRLFAGERREELPEPPAGMRLLGSQEGLLERLDDGTCMGCHQAGSMAGFHLLGFDDPGLAGLSNRLALPLSAHAQAERARRREVLAALQAGETPPTFRPHSLAPGPAGADQACLLPGQGDLLPAAAWACADPERVCSVLVAQEGVALPFGQCIVPPTRPQDLRAGMACRGGEIQAGDRVPEEGAPWNADAWDDRFVQQALYALPEATPATATSTTATSTTGGTLACRPPVIGLPLGRTFRHCRPAERALEGVLGADGAAAPELCAIVGGSAFDRCVEEDFHACLEGIVTRGMVDSCHAGRACREDYACQALPWQMPGMPTEAARAVAEAGIGFCTPTYFLFQLRLDGHPVPQ